MPDARTHSPGNTLVRGDGTIAIEPVVQAVEYAYRIISKLLPPPQREDGYLCIARRVDGKPIVTLHIGPMYAGRDGKNYALAAAEARVLAEHPECFLSSRAHPHPQEPLGRPHRAGAVAYDQCIFSVGGPWDEIGNETFAIGIAHLLFQEGMSHEVCVEEFGTNGEHDLLNVFEALDHEWD